MAKRGKKYITLIIIVSLLIILSLLGIIIYNYTQNNNCVIPTNTSTNYSKQEYLYKVTDIIDGDTVVIERGNYVRIIGINAPEKNQHYYNESKEYLADLLLNKYVRIEKDIDNSDNYGRLLRYIFIEINGKEISVGTQMVKQGFAVPMAIEPNTKYKAEIELAAKQCITKFGNLCRK